nr:hypothetical protein BaRGS_011142 [Batillaria attramentaria]
MGVYLAVIGVADLLYQGNYLWKDTAWKNSVACKVAGFLSLLSFQVSTFIVFLITADRFLAVSVPFHCVRFQRRSAHFALLAWVFGLCISAIPLLGTSPHWQVYGQIGVCLPLPTTDTTLSGHSFLSFGILIIVLNLILAALTVMGQVFVYWTLQTTNTCTADDLKYSTDLKLARRCSAVALSKAMSWLPAGLTVLVMSAHGEHISRAALASVGMFILPFNPALNPFLYTFNMIVEKRHDKRTEALRLVLMANMKNAGRKQKTSERGHADLQGKGTRAKEEAWRCFQAWMNKGKLDAERVKEAVSSLSSPSPHSDKRA